MDILIKENSWRARLAAHKLGGKQAAIVFGNVIYLWGVNKENFLQNRPWTCHEVAHVHQYKRYGTVRFVILYLLDWVRNGYYHNRFEAEARSKENDSSLLTGVRFR